MADSDWIELVDTVGRYRSDVEQLLPQDGERVVFVAWGVTYVGTYSGAFVASLSPERGTRVQPGARAEVLRWMAAR